MKMHTNMVQTIVDSLELEVLELNFPVFLVERLKCYLKVLQLLLKHFNERVHKETF